jgi:hypothetical protein
MYVLYICVSAVDRHIRIVNSCMINTLLYTLYFSSQVSDANRIVQDLCMSHSTGFSSHIYVILTNSRPAAEMEGISGRVAVTHTNHTLQRR